jgi:hypothetical protein
LAVRSSWASLWGIVGIVAMLLEAIARLVPLALSPLASGGLSVVEGAGFVASMAFFAFFEGYRGFQRAFSPRAVARALYLDAAAPLRDRLLAPLFCMALLTATRRRLVASWLLVGGIVGVILLVRLLPNPWRAMVDAGVVVGLSWGAVSLVVLYLRALLGRAPKVSLELPAGAASRPSAD